MTKLSEIVAAFVRREKRAEGAEVPPPPASNENISQLMPQEVATAAVSISSEIEITDEFQRGFDLIERGIPFLFVTGRAGTGKSTFTNVLRARLKSFAVVAPTGVAAFNVGGQTIHSFFRFAPGPMDLKKITAVKNRIAYKALRTLIIDEVSMVRADMLDAIDKFLRENGRDRSRPFGGVRVIAVGDLFQLPPIVATEEEQAYLSSKYETSFFFGAHCLKELELKTIEFSKVFRQADESFISILNRIREGRELEGTLAELNVRVSALQGDERECVVLTATNAAASKINGKKLASIEADSTIYRGEVTGEIKIEQNKLPVPMELELKPGAQVMFVKNDRQKRWVNGTVGSVVECGQSYVNVSFLDRYGKHEVRVEPEVWENQKFEYNPDLGEVTAVKIGSYKQIPLTLAWAITIHKSQGKTFNRIHLDLERGAFAEGQVYVALSRCRTLDGISIEQPLEKKDIQLNYDVIEFSRRVSQNFRACRGSKLLG